MNDFIDLIDMIAAQDLEPAEVIHILRDTLDYDRFVSDEDIASPDDVKIQNLNQLQLSATKFSDMESFLSLRPDFIMVKLLLEKLESLRRILYILEMF